MDALFKALADPARRDLLDALRAEDGQTLGALEARFAMTRFGVMKHLRVLEEAGLVTTVKRGRFKHHYLNTVPLQEMADRWIDPLLAKPATRAVIDLKARLEGQTQMIETTEKPDFVMHTLIRCSQTALWDALTKADQMAAYHFACSRARGDVADGAVTEFVRNDGSTMLTQRTLSMDPPNRLEMTFEPRFGGSDRASRVVFEIATEGAACKLTVLHYDLAPDQDGVREGWARWASSLKSWLETGTVIRMG